VMASVRLNVPMIGPFSSPVIRQVTSHCTSGSRLSATVPSIAALMRTVSRPRPVQTNGAPEGAPHGS
jgi:hypothetical protein